MDPRLRKGFGRVFVALLVMSGMVVLLGRAVIEMVAPTPGLAAAGSPTGPDVDASAYSSVFIQDVLYGAATHWDAVKVASVRDLGSTLESQVTGYPQAEALVADQVAYMDWLLSCHDTMAGATDAVEAGIFGSSADNLAKGLNECRGEAITWVQSSLAHASQFPSYALGSVPGYGSWDQAAFAEFGLLDLRASPALDALLPFSSFFGGDAIPGSGPTEVAALLGGKSIRPPLTSAGSSAWALASPKVDASTAVAVWMRASLAGGDADVRLELRESGGELRLCGASSIGQYCPTGSGDLLESLNASASSQGLTVFGAGDSSGENWGFIVRNAGASDATGLTARAECVDGSLSEEWDIGDVSSGSQVFSGHAFDEGASCLATLEIRDGDGDVVLRRVGEIAGELGFAL